ncbi:MAG: hypothetical protein QG568_97, partial [Patescibacteria group bacterium]|nr:hypothetical protein [Patescibacteria group bacterium]
MFSTFRLLFVSLLALSFILPSTSLSETVYTNEQSQDILNFINQNQTNNSTGIPQTVEELQEFVQGVSTNQTNEGTGPIDALTGKRTLTPGEVIKSSTPIDTPVVTIPSTSQSPQQSSQQTSQNSTSNTSGGLSYTLLAPIKTFFPSGSVNISDGGLGVYLNNMYRIGIAVATGLALVMIVVGGLQYVSTDSIQGKSDGKGRIQDALIGLLLALTSYIILNQINPNLLRSELKVAATKSTGRVNTVDVQLVEGGG